MAQDARILRALPSGPHSVLDPQLSEKTTKTEWMSGAINHAQNEQTSHDQFPELPRNGTLELSPNVLQALEEASTEDGQDHVVLEKRLRTLPAWIGSVDYKEPEGESSAASRLLPSHPDDAVVAQHNHSPYTTAKVDFAGRGTSLEEGRATSPRESRWKNFSKSIAYPRDPGAGEKLVTPEWLNENHGDYSQPWRGRLEDWSGEDTEDPLRMKRRREIWFKRFHHTLLKSPIVPLVFRLTVWVFSLTALALGASIQHMSRAYVHPQGPSALMAIIVDAVALVYLVYITWDEYTSKPLGLRSPSAKARLVLLDIFFIVFDSANLSLAFESLSTVSGACTIGEVNQQVAPKNDAICDRQIALASVLLIALLAWLTTFAISVLRLVDRAAQ
ncbi:hypothetical protein ABOM_002385 [Aspergillus bombycis]|uniref:Regulator of phospholipase D SRF1 n=1 Tax=Aspergillus bombycis TaxID=109264 RepID=A0A1F8A9W3_9EURO|nr:hypothetical protein ABOM_002385 [Aspergillus bombycis]OGM48530.1 hypothetical protein ABOM_002385 [Aspergillus bombycis]